MTEWFTADLHLGHDNIIRYCDRPFKTVTDMNQALIENWNARVGSDDTAYLLGDFCMARKREEVQEYRDQLNGKIILVRGNHDHKITRKVFQPDCFDDLPLEIGPYKCILAHRPFYPPQIEVPARDQDTNAARQASYGAFDFVISGHIHEKRLWTGKSFNVGVDKHDFFPLSFEEVLSHLENFNKN